MKRLFLSFFFLSLLWPLQAQYQIGQVIDGETLTDLLGYSVSLNNDGSRLALGAPFATDSISSKGAVRMYQWADSVWEAYGPDIIGDTAWERFGKSVALSGNGERVAVGAPSGFDSLGVRTGVVRVMEWNGSAWVQLGNLISGDSIFDSFGEFVSISEDGNRVAVSAPDHWSALSPGGMVKVFDWNGSQWIQTGATFYGTQLYALFGSAISLSKDGSRLAISAMYQNNGPIYNVGAVWVYEWQGTNWTLVGTPFQGQVRDDVMGKSVSLNDDGSIVAMSARTYDNLPPYDGRAYTYRWNGTTWLQRGSTITGPEGLGNFAYSLSLSGDGNLLGIGAANRWGKGESFIRKWDGTDWRGVGVRMPGEEYRDSTGWSVALSKDGNRFAVGSPNETLTGWAQAKGAARVYEMGPYLLEGFIRRDLNNNCQADANETVISDIWVNLTKDSSLWEYQVAEDGYYGFYLEPGMYQLSKGEQTYPYSKFCPSNQTIDVDTALSSLPTLDIPVQDSIFCPLVEVSIRTSNKYACYPGKYFISYKNTGTIPAINGEIELSVPEQIVISETSHPIHSSQGKVYTFLLDTLDIDEEGLIVIDFVENCDYLIGASYCAEVYFRPDSLCLQNLPNIRVEQECLSNGDLRFTVTNLGDSYPQPTPALVVDGFTRLEFDTLQLLPNQAETVDYRIPTNSRTKFQLILGDYNEQLLVTPVIACRPDAYGNYWAPKFPQGYQDATCWRITAKPVFWETEMAVQPEGIGAGHEVDSSQTLTYSIRYFNYSNDSVNHVEIMDTLSRYLDVNSISLDPGDTLFSLTVLPPTPDGRPIIKLIGNSLKLPPRVGSGSNKNFIDSVSFHVDFASNIPEGTVIANYAYTSIAGRDFRQTNAVYNTLIYCPNLTGIDVVESCEPYTWIDGQTYSFNTNTPTFTLTSASGCDSIVTLNLSLDPINPGVFQVGRAIGAEERDAVYQWFDCNGNPSLIFGATNRFYIPTANGDYKVQIERDGCTVTSDCFSFTTVSNEPLASGIEVYPNPTSGHINIDFGQSRRGIKLELFNLLGEKVQEREVGSQTHIEWEIKQSKGVYLLRVSSEDGLLIDKKLVLK